MVGEVPNYSIATLRQMVENFGKRLEVATVSELSERGIIFVEDGNHGENRPRQNEFTASGIAFLRPPDLIDGRVDFHHCGRINEMGFQRVRKGIGRRGDIILTHRATVGRIAITGDDAPDVFVTNPGTTIWRSTNLDILDQKYLYCFMRSTAFMDQLWSQVGNNSTFDYVSLTQQRGLHVAFPPLPEQKAIADILGSLDDKIELNRRTNETLETMARAIFKSWFVVFDPVHAKSQGRQPEGMDAETARFFPSSFEDSEIGKVPKGWRIDRLGNALNVVETGFRPKGGIRDITEGVPSVGAESIVGLGQFDYSKTKYVPRHFFEEMSRGHVCDGDVLLYKDGGRPGEFEPHLTMVGKSFPFPAFCINEHVYRLRTAPTLPQSYLFFWLSSDSVMDEMRNRGTGVAIPGLNSTAVRELILLSPETAIVASFDAIVSPLLDRILANCNESRNLAIIRDALLPRLLSGEIAVPTSKVA